VNAVCGDTTSRSDLASALRVAAGHSGGLDVVVAQAGIADIRDFALIDDATWERLLNVNVTGAFRCIQEAAAVMLNGGSVVLVASTNASFPEAHTVHYSTSKGAVVALARAASLDLAPRGIRVNVICPGIIDTRLATVLTRDPVAGPAYLRRVPLGRWGEPADIGDAAAFLASSEASYITGQVLTVDGGATVGVALDVQDGELPGLHGAPEAS
jgi:3-oxoacyl-[acyl-carrier protein] reductase